MTDLSDISQEKIKKMSFAELDELAGQIRTKLIETVSSNGGHLASNLGVVELTIAIHNIFDVPKDSVVWDVGHQCYTHKIITGRADTFDTLRKKGGVSGFPKPEESDCDAYITGHSSTSVSLAYGIAKAKAVRGDESYTVCVVGDGSLTNGMIFEALNNCNRGNERLIIILNDNEMSIGKSVGGISRYLTNLRNGERYFKFKDRLNHFLSKLPHLGIPLRRFAIRVKDKVRRIFLRDNLFESMGLYYLGPCDGHNIRVLSRLLNRAKSASGPVVVHVKTVKGKGYEYAENNPGMFHGISNFDIETGTRVEPSENFSSVLGGELNRLCNEDDSIYAISAAMVSGTGLGALPPERVIDVGIAEEHAVTFCAGMASRGMKPVCALYSTFLQRAYDQINHDVCLPDTHVVFGIDRAGIVGEDGETHQGVFDVSMLNPMPNIEIYSPATFEELKKSIHTALYETKHPAAVRYPRGGENKLPEPDRSGDGFKLYGNGKILLITYGILTSQLICAAEALKKSGISASVLQIIRIKPLPQEITDIAANAERIYFIEEGMKQGSVAGNLAERLLEREYRGKYAIRAIDGSYVKQSTVAEAWRQLGFDAASVEASVKEDITHEAG